MAAGQLLQVEGCQMWWPEWPEEDSWGYTLKVKLFDEGRQGAQMREEAAWWTTVPLATQEEQARMWWTWWMDISRKFHRETGTWSTSPHLPESVKQHGLQAARILWEASEKGKAKGKGKY